MKKAPKVPGFMRVVLARNVRKLMDLHFRESTNRPKSLSLAAHVSLSTVQRILAAETGATVDNIEAVAAAFQMSAYQLLIPEVNAGNPQVVHGATKDEERLYRRWKQIGTETGKFAAFVSGTNGHHE